MAPSSKPMLPPEVEGALTEALVDGPLAAVVADERGVAWMTEAARGLLRRVELQSKHAADDQGWLLSSLSEAIFRATRLEGVEHGLDAFASEQLLQLCDGTQHGLSIAASEIAGAEPAALGVLTDLGGGSDVDECERRAELRFQRLVESMPSCVWILHRRRTIYANRAAADLAHVDPNALVGLDFCELFHVDDAEILAQDLLRVERGESVPPHECRIRTVDNIACFVELNSVKLATSDDSMILVFGRNVTDRKREEQRLLQADRLSSLGMLASGMAHAINNPLTYVLLNLDHLSRRMPNLAKDKEVQADVMARLAEAREGAERMAAIVKRMRAFARADESSARVLDLRNVLESVVELVGHEVHHRGRLTTHFESVPPVLANESKVEQICLGLLLFAAQMLPDDAAHRREIALSLKVAEGGMALLEITCEGCELPANDLERLFDPFAPTDGGRALGFGLSVCRGLVEQLGGQIEARTLPAVGLLLHTSFPCVSLQRLTEIVPSSAPPSSLPPPPSGKARVLVVDDDPGVARALRLMLQDENDVKSIARPREALQELLSDPGYDLVFCDLMMPELSGMDIYQVLRFNRPGYEAKMVFMTGGAFTQSARRFLAQVQNPRIEKPFNLQSVMRLVQTFASRRNRHG